MLRRQVNRKAFYFSPLLRRYLWNLFIILREIVFSSWLCPPRAFGIMSAKINAVAIAGILARRNVAECRRPAFRRCNRLALRRFIARVARFIFWAWNFVMSLLCFGAMAQTL